MTTYNSAFDGTNPFSDTTCQFALAANTALSYTVPGDNSMSYRAEFSFLVTDSVWVGYNVTPTVPSAGTISSTANIERNPVRRYVRGGDVLKFISGAIVGNAGFSLLRLP